MGALELVTWWPVDAASGGVVVRRPGSTGDESIVVDGVGDIERPFAWASITKLLVAMAVLVAVEEGTISLDEPAGPPGSTLRHLLSHASGLGPDSPVPVAAPGRMRIYSNIGYEVLADTLAQRAHMPFTDYLAGGVLNPLQMAGTSLVPGSSPASGAQGPLRDLLVLAAELLVPTILSTATLAAATDVAFPGLRGVLPGYGRFDPCDWGLGFEVKGTKHPHWTGSLTTVETFGHFGRAGGFVWVDPVAGLACATLSNRDFGPWAVDEWSTLADAVVEEWASPPVPKSATTDALEARRLDREEAQRETERRAREAALAEAAETERRAHEAAQAEAAETERRAHEAALAEAAETERRAHEAAQAEAAEAERRAHEAAQAEAAEAERRAREAAEAERRAREAALAERRAREAALAEAAETERRAHEAALAEAAETERRAHEAALAEAAETERRAHEAALAEAAETERRAHEAAQAEAAETERRAHEAALAEFWRRNAADADRRQSREAARAEEAETERRQREAAKAKRRDRESRAPSSNGGKRKKKAADVDLRVAAMTERRDEAVARLPDAEPAGTTSDDVGPLGPGIRPADFWGT